jgi:hypothetical protein
MVAADGATQPVYERYRRGGRIEWVLENARVIAAAKRRCGSSTPILRWQYLTFAHNVQEIPGAIELARDIGFDTFTLATPNEVSCDDPSIECVEYPGERCVEFRPSPELPFTSDLSPYRDMIEGALSESAIERWQRATDGQEDGLALRLAAPRSYLRCSGADRAVLQRRL